MTRRHRYCGPCGSRKRDERLQRRGEMSPERLAHARELDAVRDRRRKARGLSATDRYPASHAKRRWLLAPKVATGQVPCARCGLLIGEGQAWDLGHDDEDRSRYAGPEHRYARDCPKGGNRATARHRAERQRVA